MDSTDAVHELRSAEAGAWLPRRKATRSPLAIGQNPVQEAVQTPLVLFIEAVEVEQIEVFSGAPTVAVQSS